MSVPPLPPPGFVATPLEWRNVTFVGTAHLLALSSIAWLVAARCSPWTIALGFVWFVLCGLAVTGGYHRLFAHPTYRAKAVVRAAYLVLGAAAVQNSALKWAADHRLHHAKTDREEDPYNIRRGFWWAHMGWVFHKDASPIESRRVQDLSADPLVRWQDRHYVLIALLVGAALPALLGTAWRDPIGAVLVAGFLRLVVQWHATGLVNSFAHRFGRRPYSLETSARDSGWMALFTFGESYHNFHHRFQGDYRNGARWWQFDPTKWFVWSLARVGLARDLRRTPVEALARARADVLRTERETRNEPRDPVPRG
jgi:stearoyl-CoA desaturase (delta-9 desaturase)